MYISDAIVIRVEGAVPSHQLVGDVAEVRVFRKT
jgi:hypothetical protein